MGEKTEKPTPKKLRDAKRKGQVAKSQDFPAAFTFVASIGMTLSMVPSIFRKLADLFHSCLAVIREPNLETILPAILKQSILLIFSCVVPIVLFVAVVGMISTFISVGPVWAPEVFKFDIKKFDVVQNLKGKFKIKTFVELLKSILKLTIAGIIVYRIVYSNIPTVIQTIHLPVLEALAVFAELLKEVIFKIGLFFVAIAVFDLMYQKHNFEKEMMMEKFEIKQEYKDTEGDPQIKGKRKQIAQEIAYQEGPAGAAKGAKAVVTNPTHLAIALEYEKELDPCPFILAMGEGPLAEQIIRVAEQNDVPIIRNIPLAHKLWQEGAAFEYVPETTYEPVAEVLRWVASLTDPELAETEEGESILG